MRPISFDIQRWARCLVEESTQHPPHHRARGAERLHYQAVRDEIDLQSTEGDSELGID